MGNLLRTDLVSRVRCGGLDFERFVEVLETEGDITEENRKEGCSPTSAVMEAARQDDFDKLFDFFFPGRSNDIQLECTATNEGFEPDYRNCFSHAIFNASVIDEMSVKRILAAENRAAAERRASSDQAQS